MISKRPRSGGCLCGSVHVTVELENGSVGICHCEMCRRWGGGPFFSVECEGPVRFDGADSIAIFNSSSWAERGFCRVCGTHLFYRLKEREHYAIPVGLFDSSDEWELTEQIFIDQKPPFYSFSQDTRNLTGAEAFAQNSGD